MNEKAILSIAYFPNIQYITKFIKYKEIFIEQYESYQKQSYRNRTLVLTTNGPSPLIIPVIKENNKKTKISEVEIDFQKKWQHQHWMTIKSAYGNSPFFEYYESEIKDLIFANEHYLFNFNLNIIKKFLFILKIEYNIKLTDSFVKVYNNAMDLRNLIHPKIKYEDIEFKPIKYPQVFSNKFQFIQNLSIIDLLFNMGTESKNILYECINKN